MPLQLFPSKDLTAPEYFYRATYGELPPRDLDAVDLPVLFEIFNTLTPREAQIVKMRYGFGYARATFEAIGQEFSISGSRAREILGKTTRKLNQPSRARRIKQLFLSPAELRQQIADLEEALRQANQTKTTIEREFLDLREQWRTEKGLEADSVLDQLIEGFNGDGLSVRTANCLRRSNLKTVRDVALYLNQHGDLMRIRNLGQHSNDEVLRLLERLEVRLGQPEEFYFQATPTE